jgi:hypothetical protein
VKTEISSDDDNKSGINESRPERRNFGLLGLQ